MGSSTAKPLLRTSERSGFKRCRWKWYLEYMRLVKPKTDVPPLRFGSLIHGALAAWYVPGVRRGVHPAITFEKLYEADVAEAEKFGFRVDDDEKWVEAGELGDAMLRHYVDFYGKDDEWKVLVTEQPFRVLVKHENPFYYVGVLDGIWQNRSSKRIVIPDHKSAAAINTRYLALDEQGGSYWTFGLEWIYKRGFLKRGDRLQGMLYNFLRKAKPDERPQNAEGHYLNKDGSVSKQQPPPYFHRQLVHRDTPDRDTLYNRVQYEWGDIRAAYAGKIELYKNPGQFTCPGCWAFDICELHETGNDWEGMMRATTKSWDPYAEHEIYDGR